MISVHYRYTRQMDSIQWHITRPCKSVRSCVRGVRCVRSVRWKPRFTYSDDTLARNWRQKTGECVITITITTERKRMCSVGQGQSGRLPCHVCEVELVLERCALHRPCKATGNLLSFLQIAYVGD